MSRFAILTKLLACNEVPVKKSTSVFFQNSANFDSKRLLLKETDLGLIFFSRHQLGASQYRRLPTGIRMFTDLGSNKICQSWLTWPCFRCRGQKSTIFPHWSTEQTAASGCNKPDGPTEKRCNHPLLTIPCGGVIFCSAVLGKLKVWRIAYIKDSCTPKFKSFVTCLCCWV